MKKVGIIGFGKMGILHAGIINSFANAQIRAICERNRFLVSAAKALLPKNVTFYNDHNDMLDHEELDAVVITTPINSHVTLICDLSSGKRPVSLLVEKPLASTHKDAVLACNAIKDSGGIHMVGFQKRFSPIFQKAKQVVGSGDLGEPMFFRAYSYSSDVLRAGRSWRSKRGTGGVLLDLAPHLLDITLWLFDEPRTVAAMKKQFYSKEVDDYVHVMMSFPSGLNGHLDVCWSVREFRLPEIRIEVRGTKGVLTVTDDFVGVTLYEDGETVTSKYYKQSFDSTVSFLLADPEYTIEDEAFLSAEKAIPGVSFDDAARVNYLIDRIEKATE